MAPLPWIPDVIRERLLEDSTFTLLIGPSRVGFQQPPDVAAPFVVIQAPGNIPISGDGVAWSPLVQVDGYCMASDPLARKITWDLVSAAAYVLGRTRNVTYQTISYSARITDGPMEGAPDKSRGDSSVLIRSLIRAELTVHAR